MDGQTRRWAENGAGLIDNENCPAWVPAYDCAANRWVSLTVAGPSPAGKDGRNVSAGVVYDAKRGLIWATDTHGQIYVLRLDAAQSAR